MAVQTYSTGQRQDENKKKMAFTWLPIPDEFGDNILILFCATGQNSARCDTMKSNMSWTWVKEVLKTLWCQERVAARPRLPSLFQTEYLAVQRTHIQPCRQFAPLGMPQRVYVKKADSSLQYCARNGPI